MARKRANKTARPRDNETTGPRDRETTGRRDNGTTRQRKNTGVLSLSRRSQAFSVVRGSARQCVACVAVRGRLASEWCRYNARRIWRRWAVLRRTAHCRHNSLAAVDAPLSRQAPQMRPYHTKLIEESLAPKNSISEVEGQIEILRRVKTILC